MCIVIKKLTFSFRRQNKCISYVLLKKNILEYLNVRECQKLFRNFTEYTSGIDQENPKCSGTPKLQNSPKREYQNLMPWIFENTVVPKISHSRSKYFLFKSFTFCPFFKNTKVGMAEMLYSWATSSASSTSTLRKTTLDISPAIASIFGEIILQGPHQVAKKSMTTNLPRKN